MPWLVERLRELLRNDRQLSVDDIREFHSIAALFGKSLEISRGWRSPIWIGCVPDFFVEFYKRTVLPLSPNEAFRRQLDVSLDGLRKAGVRKQ